MFELKVKHKERKLTISFYGGEPLVNIRFIKQIVEAARQLNVGKELELKFSMTTNATLIHKHIDFLVENQFGLLISLDGDEEGQSYRLFVKNNQNSFSRVIENIDMILRDYPEYFEKHVNFNAVLHNRNSIQSIHEFIYARYHKIPRISQLNTGELNPDKKELFEQMFHGRRKSEEDYPNEASDLLPGIREEFSSYKELSRFVKNCSINYYISNLLYLFYDRINMIPTGTCKPFSKKIFLDTQHNLYPCEKINYKYSMGKVNKNIMIDLSGIARQFTYYYEQFTKVCQNCYSSSRACTICMLTIGNLDKLDTEELVCYGFQDQEAFKAKLERVFSLFEKQPDDFLKITGKLMING